MTFFSRNSANRILMICKGFLKNPVHLARQFAWLTNTSSLLGKIEKNLLKQLGKMVLSEFCLIAFIYDHIRLLGEVLDVCEPDHHVQGRDDRRGDRV